MKATVAVAVMPSIAACRKAHVTVKYNISLSHRTRQAHSFQQRDCQCQLCTRICRAYCAAQRVDSVGGMPHCPTQVIDVCHCDWQSRNNNKKQTEQISYDNSIIDTQQRPRACACGSVYSYVCECVRALCAERYSSSLNKIVSAQLCQTKCEPQCVPHTIWLLWLRCCIAVSFVSFLVVSFARATSLSDRSAFIFILLYFLFRYFVYCLDLVLLIINFISLYKFALAACGRSLSNLTCNMDFNVEKHVRKIMTSHYNNDNNITTWL